jgi:hypothetical protein
VRPKAPHARWWRTAPGPPDPTGWWPITRQTICRHSGWPGCRLKTCASLARLAAAPSSKRAGRLARLLLPATAAEGDRGSTHAGLRGDGLRVLPPPHGNGLRGGRQRRFFRRREEGIESWRR